MASASVASPGAPVAAIVAEAGKKKGGRRYRTTAQQDAIVDALKVQKESAKKVIREINKAKKQKVKRRRMPR